MHFGRVRKVSLPPISRVVSVVFAARNRAKQAHPALETKFPVMLRRVRWWGRTSVMCFSVTSPIDIAKKQRRVKVKVMQALLFNIYFLQSRSIVGVLNCFTKAALTGPPSSNMLCSRMTHCRLSLRCGDDGPLSTKTRLSSSSSSSLLSLAFASYVQSS